MGAWPRPVRRRTRRATPSSGPRTPGSIRATQARGIYFKKTGKEAFCVNLTCNFFLFNHFLLKIQLFRSSCQANIDSDPRTRVWVRGEGRVQGRPGTTAHAGEEHSSLQHCHISIIKGHLTVTGPPSYYMLFGYFGLFLTVFAGGDASWGRGLGGRTEREADWRDARGPGQGIILSHHLIIINSYRQGRGRQPQEDCDTRSGDAAPRLQTRADTVRYWYC